MKRSANRRPPSEPCLPLRLDFRGLLKLAQDVANGPIRPPAEPPAEPPPELPRRPARKPVPNIPIETHERLAAAGDRAAQIEMSAYREANARAQQDAEPERGNPGPAHPAPAES